MVLIKRIALCIHVPRYMYVYSHVCSALLLYNLEIYAPSPDKPITKLCQFVFILPHVIFDILFLHVHSGHRKNIPSIFFIFYMYTRLL